MESALTMEEMTKDALLAALSWQVEAGGDEALLDEGQMRDGWAVSMAEIMANQRDVPVDMPVDMPAPVSAPVSATVSVSAPEMPAGKPEAQALMAKRGESKAPNLNKVSDLAGLKEAMMRFEGCDLKRTASNLVFSDGNPSAQIMIIGESPGKDEDRMGLPFVGSAGQLLDQMLGAVGLDRTSVYIANIMPWRPPGNRALTVEEVEMMRPFIEAHIRLIAPKVILALGGSAAKTLLQSDDGIMKLRGKLHEFTPQTDGDKVPLLPCLHPGYLLRSPHHKAFAFKDLVALRTQFG